VLARFDMVCTARARKADSGMAHTAGTSGPCEKSNVIYNGVGFQRQLRSRSEAFRSGENVCRASLGVNPETLLIGSVGRGWQPRRIMKCR